MAEPIVNQIEQVGQNAVANYGKPNTSSPFILDPFTGKSASNPGFLNALQAFDLYLQQNPNVAGELAAMESNEKQKLSLASPSDLSLLRNPSTGQNSPYGSTYGDLMGGSGTTPSVYQNPGQSEEVTQLQNAITALNSAYLASKNIQSSGGGITNLLGKGLSSIGLGGVASDLLPSYASYQQSLGALAQNPYTQNAAGLFSIPGAAPQESEYQTYLSNLQNTLSRLNQPSPPVSNAGTMPMSSMDTNPYTSTQNSIIAPNPAQLGANARSSIGR